MDLRSHLNVELGEYLKDFPPGRSVLVLAVSSDAEISDAVKIDAAGTVMIGLAGTP